MALDHRSEVGPLGVRRLRLGAVLVADRPGHEHEQRVTGPDPVARTDQDLADGAVDGGGHGVLHLHRLDDDQRRALVHVRPGLHQDPDHSALQGRHHLVHWAVNLPLLGQAARTA